MAYYLNAGAQHFNPGGNLVSEPPSPYLEARLVNLEGGYADLYRQVDTLKDLYRDLHDSFGKVERQPVDPVKSNQSAKLSQKELEQSSHGTRPSFNGDTNVPPKTNDSATSVASNQKPLPPHLRRAEQSGIVHSNSHVSPLHSLLECLLTSAAVPPNCRWTQPSTSMSHSALMVQLTQLCARGPNRLWYLVLRYRH